MAFPVQIPKATLTLEEAHIVGWKKPEGGYFFKDEPILEIETDKVVMDVPSPATGYLLRIIVPDGPARVEQVVGWVGALGEEIDEVSISEPAWASSTQVRIEPSHDSNALRSAAATPAARRLARELGVKLSAIRGSGPGGRITEKDVEAAAGLEPGGSPE